MTTDRYEALCTKYLQDGERLLAEGDLAQASEKYWGAVAQMIKVAAIENGWRHSNHRALRDVIRSMYEATENGQYLTLWRSAERLHTNFYEDDLDSDSVKALAADAQTLVSMLRPTMSGDTR